MRLTRWMVISAASFLFMTSQLPAQNDPLPGIVGDCGDIHESPLCSDEVCTACVCDDLIGADTICCAEYWYWDQFCVDAANGRCITQCTVSPTLPASDTDGDGFPDDEDECPDSDLNDTVIIDSCDSGVLNTLDADGCTLSDEIAVCADGARNHGAYARCVSHFTNALVASGALSEADKDALQRCAGAAGIP